MNSDNINEISNVIRVLPDTEKNYDEIVRHEVKALNKKCQQQSPAPVLLIHQVQGADRASKVIRRFYPDIVIVDAISDATYLKEKLPAGIQEKVYHVTPASNADLMILGPQLITQGYDLQHFGEYLISRYRNYHGHPNDTYIYYLNTRPESLKKATSFFKYEFDQILGDSERAVLDRLVKCETEAEQQGSFVISLLENSILRLDIDLPLTASGSSTFLSSYSELFPHHFAELCESLRLFLKGESADAMTQANIHLIDDYSEFTIKQPGFWIEVRLEEKQSILTIKSNPDEKLEKRCFTIFALLNASNIFNRLPDKEILIEIISLMWENYSHSRGEQGFLITLVTSAQGSDLKVFQSENNRIMLKEGGEEGQNSLQFIGSFPYQRNLQRFLMKLLSLFFSVNREDPQENTWRFACFEAASQTFANSQSHSTVNVNFSIQGERWSGDFFCDSREPHSIAERSRQTIEAGAQKVHISANGREVKLIRNPTREDLEEKEPEVTLEKELQNLEANAILQQVEDEKSKEAEARSVRLQSIYDAALKAHNKKYGFDEDEIAAEEKKGKSLEEALKIKMYQRKQPDQTRLKKIRRRILAAVGVVMLAAVITVYCLFNLTTKPAPNQGLLFSEATSYVPSPTPKAPQEQPPAKVSLPPDPAIQLIEKACRNLAGDKAPSHSELNILLKELYFASQQEKYQDSPDIFNIIGRLFWYKIYIEHFDRYFDEKWINLWRQEAAKAFTAASVRYQQKKYHSAICITITNWKPERRWYPNQQNFVRYASPQEAVDDLRKVQAMLRKTR